MDSPELGLYARPRRPIVSPAATDKLLARYVRNLSLQRVREIERIAIDRSVSSIRLGYINIVLLKIPHADT